MAFPNYQAVNAKSVNTESSKARLKSKHIAEHWQILTQQP